MMPNRYAAAIAAAAVLGLSACAPYPVFAPGQAMPMARMDEQMIAMRAMHEQMTRATKPEERTALMAEHHRLMEDGLGMMGGMGPGGRGGMVGGPGAMGADPAARQPWMEKRMEMMQSMMQMMMDRLPPAPVKP